MTGKRNYTVPILLAIATILLFVIVVLFSKLLLTEQAAKTDKGIRLASSYNSCVMFADGLNKGVGDLAASADAASRLPVMQRIGQAETASADCGSLLVQAQTQSGSPEDQATAAVSDSVQTILDRLHQLGAHDGPLTDEELAAAKTIQAAGAEIGKTLEAYVVPTGGDRYRQMAAGAEWPDVARRALQQLQDLAAALK